MVDQQMKLFEDGGLNQQGGEGQVDDVSGNEVPVGSLKEEVRDDINANLSEGEFVIPADVVRYIGLETLMKLRDKAKAGLARMEEIGQMGNADEVANPDQMHGGEMPQEDDTQFASAVDQAMSEVDGGQQQFAEGGYVKMADGGDVPSITQQSPGTGAPLTKFSMKAYTNAAGQTLYVPFLGSEPLLTIPAGYTAGNAAPAEEKTTVEPTAGVTTVKKEEQGGADAGDASGGGTPNDGLSMNLGLETFGLGLMAYGQSAFGLMPGAGIANAIGTGIVDSQLENMGNIFDALEAANAAGTGVSIAANGDISFAGPDYGSEYGVDYGEMGPDYGTDYGPDVGPDVGPDYGTEYGADVGTTGGDSVGIGGATDNGEGTGGGVSVGATGESGDDSGSAPASTSGDVSGDTSGAVSADGDVAKGGFINKKNMNKNKKKGIASRR